VPVQFGDGPQTLIHYDYRVEDMFFRVDDSDAFCLVDWQLVARGRPGWGFACLVGSNLPVCQRRELENELRELYLDGNRCAGVTGYSRGELDRDLAFATMAMTVIGVIGGANADLSHPRNGGATS
jgi:aminoglycoside/choline kinase family phosphotransferase